MRKVNDAPFSGPQFSVLSESQIKDIHLASLEVLTKAAQKWRGFHYRWEPCSISPRND
jgi:trimethylamine:corrinoid methyltransferase-like protein